MKKTVVSALSLIFLTASIFAAGEFTIVWKPSALSNNLSWTLPQVQLSGTYQFHAVDIYRTFGYSTGVDSWTLIAAGVTDGKYTDYSGYGSYSYKLRNVVQWNMEVIDESEWWYSYSWGDLWDFGPVSSYFIHGADNSRGLKRSDAKGGQETYNTEWKFEYYLQFDCYVDVRIYKPGTKFTLDSEGFYERPASTWCIRTIVDYKDTDSAARSGEMGDGSWMETEVWDCTDSSGNLVAKGIYYIVFEAFDPFNPPETFEMGYSTSYYSNWASGIYKKRDAIVATIPVDILRVKNLAVTGINQTNATSSISYDINAAAEIKVVILQSGKGFAIATSSGEISYGSGSSYNYKEGDLIPASGVGSDIVTVISYYRQAGKNIETWDGTGGSGAVANGLYHVGICARDSSDNTAISIDGNDQPFYATITVDKRTTESSVESTAPALLSVSPSSGTTVASVSVITVDLSDDSGVNAALTKIELIAGATTYSHANGNAIQSPITGTGTTFTLTLSSAVTTEGPCKISITAVDIYNNQMTYSVTFSISTSGVSATTNFEDVVCAYPQPAKNGYIDIAYDTLASAIFGVGTSVSLTLEVYTIFGEMVKSVPVTDNASPYRWTYASLNLAPGVYIYRLKASGNSKNYETVKKVVIYK